MKKLFSIILVFAISLPLLAGGIGNAKELQEFIEACNSGADISPWYNADSVVVITADIDLAKAKKLPQVTSFGGRFDGQGHRLLNWKAAGGLFKAVAKGGSVRGIIIDASCSMKAAGKGGEQRWGFIADYNGGTIEDCENHGSIVYSCTYAMSAISVGGIAGFNRFVIKECRNYGSISSDTAGEYKEEISICVGGIAGSCSGKAYQGSTIVHCENHGSVKAVSSLAAVLVGGIVGMAGRTTLKYDVNRGAVLVDIREGEEGKNNGVARVGGLAGNTKADIVRCDNFGAVESKGACAGVVGGICGMPHESLVILDCINFGSVKAAGEQPSHAGGIAGNIGRPVRVRACTNYGKVSFEGVSSRARSTAAGIVGNIYVTKDALEGAYVRDCVNHGEIFAAAGGNKYDANNRNAIHAAGVVGYAEARPGLRCFVKDCSNDGKVSCASGRQGSICASAVSVITGGKAPEDYAKVLDAVPAEGNVRGSVLTPDGKPIEGIVVTDGLQCVKTGSDGRFAMNSDFAQARFIYLSLPAEAVIPTLEGVPQFFKRIPRYAKAVEADFTLQMREAPRDYTVMMIADPQVRPYNWDGSMEAWRDVVSADAEAFRASCSGDIYSINLGDLMYNYMYAWDDYMDVAAGIKCPTFNVIGNHDYDQGNLFQTEQGNMYFETYVGPEHYSFDLGGQHYVVVNTILYDRAKPTDSYHYGLDERTMTWLENDLAFVPKDKVIIACAHAQLFKKEGDSPNGSHSAYNMNYRRYRDLLASYKKVYSWCGHYHRNFYYNYEGKQTRHGAPNIECISVARATGGLRSNKALDPNGTPQGYVVMNVKGDDIGWYYKSVGRDASYQMRVYSPSKTGDGTVQVRIWNWSEGWTVPHWCVKGEDAGEMEEIKAKDPGYLDLYNEFIPTIKDKRAREWAAPVEDRIFAVTPAPGVREGEIRVTDMFGHEYVQSVSW